MSHEDLSDSEYCCANCGIEDSKITRWDVSVTVEAVDEFELDPPHEVKFCTFGCYREFVDGDVTIEVDRGGS